MPAATFDLTCLSDRGLPEARFDAGETVFLEDDTGQCMYVVRAGTISIIDYGKVLENIGPGGMFGEMALIDDGCRSASALALEPTDVIRIDRDAFLHLVRDEPRFALAVMRTLADRLRQTKTSSP